MEQAPTRATSPDPAAKVRQHTPSPLTGEGWGEGENALLQPDGRRYTSTGRHQRLIQPCPIHPHSSHASTRCLRTPSASTPFAPSDSSCRNTSGQHLSTAGPSSLDKTRRPPTASGQHGYSLPDAASVRHAPAQSGYDHRSSQDAQEESHLSLVLQQRSGTP